MRRAGRLPPRSPFCWGLADPGGGHPAAGVLSGIAQGLLDALRIARFHTSNEFSDWDTALHTFIFANAVHQGLRRAPSAELRRGVFDAALSVYLDRFLNVPPAQLPEPDDEPIEELAALLASVPRLLDRQQQVSEAGSLVARYLYGGGDAERLMATLGGTLLREDRNFHTIQAIEAVFHQFNLLRGTPESIHVLVAAARYLAAHAPTMRRADLSDRLSPAPGRASLRRTRARSGHGALHRHRRVHGTRRRGGDQRWAELLRSY